MAMRLEQTLTITDLDGLGACAFCGSPKRDPDDMDQWAGHLTTIHGYRVVSDTPREASQRARTIILELGSWSVEAQFQANNRVDIAPAWQKEGERRGTVVGWIPATTQYIVAFDREPLTRVLPADALAPYEPKKK